MSTREAFESWYQVEVTGCRGEWVQKDEQNKYHERATNEAWHTWQACQAKNDTVIAEMAKKAEINEALYRDDITELKENLRIAKSSADAEALEVDSRGKLIAELVEALERLDGWLEVRNLGGLMPEEKALIAKHKG